MDQVFPALNNVARHLRPFVVVAWACRRATELATKQGADRIAEADLLDFVSRIEVIYAWSLLEAHETPEEGEGSPTGILRAGLEGDLISGQVLTPKMVGVASVHQISAEGRAGGIRRPRREPRFWDERRRS